MKILKIEQVEAYVGRGEENACNFIDLYKACRRHTGKVCTVERFDEILRGCVEYGSVVFKSGRYFRPADGRRIDPNASRVEVVPLDL